jgi:oxalate decarboxylase/phosphoglucose isomerase-like protein (cupin superfamily)
MPSKFVDPASLPTWTFDWGVIKPLVAADNTDGAAVSMMHVILLPGKGHDRHNHPDSDEILYVLAGEGDQMVDDGAPQRVRAGDTIFIPKGAFHSTINAGYEPMTILAVYAPAGAEDVLKTLPDFQELAGGEPPAITRTI